ncbi:hypothetical protein [Phycicoccus avicenniae]|uniref:hypothetical protein n=1 Tax=Phycicoccus avicenniae TaxID=2828860 RepID=UPI003D2AC322
MTDDGAEAASASTDEVNGTTLASDITGKEAAAEIATAVDGRRGAARRYVLWLRRRQPEATPTELIGTLERHYVTAISAAGAAVTVGSIAVTVGLDLIPGGGAAKTGGKVAAKTATKVAAREALKTAGKKAALSAAKQGAQKSASLLPAGDAKIQFEITGLFALALAEIHGMELDDQQSQALIYGLANGRLSQERIAEVAADVASTDGRQPASVGHAIAQGRGNWGHWAETLASSLPGGQAQELVRGMELSALDDVRASMKGRQSAAAEYGMGAAVGGVTRFVFGRQVVDAAREAFSAPPGAFPQALHIDVTTQVHDKERSRAFLALEEAAKSAGGRLGTGVAAVGTGAATAAGAVTKPFRHVDLDGDGVPDEPQAATALKNATSAAGRLARPFRSVDLDGDGVPDERQAVTAMKGLKRSMKLPRRSRGEVTTDYEAEPTDQTVSDSDG